MKKMILAAAVVVVMAAQAQADDATLKVMAEKNMTSGVIGAYNPANGGTGAGGAFFTWNGIGISGYKGGDHSGNRKSGFGVDLRLDLGESFAKLAGASFAAVVSPAGVFTPYVEAGVAVQPGTGGGSYKGGFAPENIVWPLPQAGSSTPGVDGKTSFAGGGGISWHYKDFVTGVGYHTAKGVNLSIGWRF